jgi:hypothetical protein
MPAPRYIVTESQMGAPGVYVLENAPAVPIRGQRNRIVGFVGECVRGPVDKVVSCDTYQRFLDIFGGRDKNSNGGSILGHVWKALQGKRWGRLYVVRAAAAAAVKASFTLETAAGGGGTAVLLVEAANPGTWGNDVMIKVAAATNGDANYFNLAVKLYGRVRLYENITIAGTSDNTNQIIGNDDATLIRLTKLAAGRPVNHTATVDGADTDGYLNLGETVGAFTSVAGTDGVIADTDFTAAGRAMDLLDATAGVHACAVVGRSNTAIKTKIEELAGETTQKVWFACPDDETELYSDAVTERATFSTDRMSYWFNHVYITDPVTREEIVEEPFLYPMSIISQTDPDIHVGDFDNVVLTKSARRVHTELSNSVRDALTRGGVSFMLRDLDGAGNEVIIPGHAVTCDFAINNKDLDGRYMKDFILDAVSMRLKGDQFKGNTPANRAARKAAVSSFLDGLAQNERYIMKDENSGRPLFSYENNSSVNNLAENAQGIQRELLIARLIPKNIQILLQATIGVDATVSEQ